jgi:methyl coenzyme M reductase subunit C
MKNINHLITLVTIIATLASCSSAKELLDKAEKKDPAIVAKLARDKYPCTDIRKPDTAVVYKDSLVFVEVECPEVVVKETVIKTDTVNNVITKTIRVPVTVRTSGQVITKWYEDSAKLKIYATLSSQLNKELEKVSAEKDQYKARSEHRGKENWIWRLIATVLICWQVWKIYRKIMIKI